MSSRSEISADTWVILGALGIAAYILYRLLAAAKETVEETADAFAEPIADAWTAIFMPDPLRVNAMIRLPTGALLDVNNTQVIKTAGQDQYTFVYLGRRYELRPRDPITGYYGSALIG